MSSQRAVALTKDMVPMSNRHNQVSVTRNKAVTSGLCAVCCICTMHTHCGSMQLNPHNIRKNFTSRKHDLKLGTIRHIAMTH